MGFKRAQWHSGLTYQQTCENCKTVFQYTDYSLDYRPWYADGYVDCPRCKSHLRHNEKYAINGPESQAQQTPEIVGTAVAEEAPVVNEAPIQVVSDSNVSSEMPVFCTSCGTKFREGDRFCAQCGAKRG